MDPKELQEFLNYIFHKSKLTENQKIKSVELLARDLKPKNVKTDEEPAKPAQSSDHRPSVKFHRPSVKFQYTPPKNMQRFLREFNQDEVLKYTCHLIDTTETIESINKECGEDTYNYFKHTDLIKKHFYNLLNSFKERDIFLNKNLISLISVYITGKNLLEEPIKSWGRNINYNWGCEEILSWAKQNPGIIPNPGQNIKIKQKKSGFTLSKPFLSDITGERINSFSGLVIYFKSLFHIRHDNSLKKILNVVNNNNFQDNEFSFSENFWENIELLTDVDKLIQAYKIIIRICIKANGDEPAKFELSFYDDTNANSTFFEIHHLNSGYKKTLSNSLERIGEEQSNLIQNQINGLCDLIIEAKFGDGKSARINLWDENPKFFSTEINETIGVKYILKF